MTRKRIIRPLGAVAGIAVGLAFKLLCPDVGLSAEGVSCLGVLLGAIVWWMAGVLPEFATGLVMAALFMACVHVPATTVFSSFATGTWWLLVCAFALAAGCKRCGLMKRMAHAILRLFPATFGAQVAGLFAAGTLIGPLIPSLTAKSALLAPIADNIGTALGYQRGDRQMTGLFAAMLSGVRTIAPAAISASVVGYALWAVYPADVQQRFSMLGWFVAALPWFAVVTTLTLLCIMMLYRPRNADGKRAAASAGPHASDAKTPLTTHEKWMTAILCLTIAGWATQPLHGIESHVVGLCALVAMAATGILDIQALHNDISWESLIFIGTVFGLAEVFAYVGIDDWIVQAAAPVFQTLSQNPYLFVVGIGLLTVLLRFVIVSEMAYINVVMVFLVPLATSCGINPWVAGMVVYATVNPWFAMYQSPVYLAAYYATDQPMVHHRSMVAFCAVYLSICIIGLLASVPIWQAQGLL